MPIYEYKVVPAPEKGMKGKGTKTIQDRFALALQTAMNGLGADGWEYVRAETLPCEERAGLTGTTTSFQNMLVFRRETSASGESHAARRELMAAATLPGNEPPAPPAAIPSAAEPQPLTRPATDAAAAAAAAAALAAYRNAGPKAPKLGPAPGRGSGQDKPPE